LAVPALERSRDLATRVDDKRTLAQALRHLGIAEHRAGRLDAARDRLEESVRLRREIDLMPGLQQIWLDSSTSLLHRAAATRR